MSKALASPSLPSPSSSSHKKRRLPTGWVRLNVGGTNFVTSRQTLCADPRSALYQMFCGDSGGDDDDDDNDENNNNNNNNRRIANSSNKRQSKKQSHSSKTKNDDDDDDASDGDASDDLAMMSGGGFPVDRDESGSYLIDADPEYFAPIMNFLRLGEVVIPPSINPSGVKALALFLGVQGVTDHFNRERRQVIFSCGSGGSGELGTLEKADAPTPTCVKLIPYQQRVVEVSLGANFSAILTSGGKTYTFGNGDWGQLGLGPPKLFTEKADDRTPIVTVPTVVPTLEQKRVTRIATGYAYTMALTEDHEVYFWGNNNHGQSGLGNCHFGPSFRKVEEPVLVESLQGRSIIQLGCGSFFVLALSATGAMFSWGLVDCLGLGTTEEVVAKYGPTEIAESVSKDKRTVLLQPQQLAPIASSSRVVRINAGQWHSCAITEAGELFTWGVGFQGRLGHGDKEPRFTPTKVTGGLESHRVVDVACGSFHTVALTADGLVFCWGDNTNGQCGSSTLPEAVTRPNGVSALCVIGGGVARAVSCGRQHTAVVMCGPHPWCDEYCCRLRHDGKPQAEHGQLYVFGESKGMGLGTPQKVCTAKLVTGMERFNIQQVVSGLHHTFVVADAIPDSPH